MKTRSIPAARWLVWLLGAVGALLCVAGSLGIWYLELQINRAQERVFNRVDESFEGIERRLVETQNLAAQAKVTVEEIRQRVQEWAKNEAGDRLVTKLGVDAKAQQLAAGLHQAELMLELSHETVQYVGQVLEAGADLGIKLNADSIGPLLERIEEINQALNEAIDAAESLVQQVGEGRGDEPSATRAEQVAKIAARLLATFGKIDTRLVSFRERLADAQDSIRRLNAKTHTRILIVAACATLFLLWMAAGQIYLCRWARSC